METVSPIKIRIVGVVLLAIVIGMIAAHAFASKVDKPYFDNSANAMVGAGLMMTGIFVVLGFGLTFAYFG